MMFGVTLELVFSFIVRIIRRFAYGINKLFLLPDASPTNSPVRRSTALRTAQDYSETKIITLGWSNMEQLPASKPTLATPISLAGPSEGGEPTAARPVAPTRSDSIAVVKRSETANLLTEKSAESIKASRSMESTSFDNASKIEATSEGGEPTAARPVAEDENIESANADTTFHPDNTSLSWIYGRHYLSVPTEDNMASKRESIVKILKYNAGHVRSKINKYDGTQKKSAVGDASSNLPKSSNKK